MGVKLCIRRLEIINTAPFFRKNDSIIFQKKHLNKIFTLPYSTHKNTYSEGHYAILAKN